MKLLKKAFLGFLFIMISAGVFVGLVLLFDTAPATKPDSSELAKKPSGTKPEPSGAPKDTVNSKDNYSLNEHTRLKLTDEAGAKLLSDVDIERLVEEMLPSMVAIQATETGQNLFGQTVSAPSQGSGILIDEDKENYYIVTNAHVIENAEEITATLVGGQDVPVSVRGSDSVADLAVLALPKDSLSEETRDTVSLAALADSAEAAPGEMVIALGNSLGYGTSVTVGYISATNRNITTGSGITMTLIQTDAAINPGNSGGALINLNGELIGINSSKLSSVAVEGMGFAIPASSALPVLRELQSMEDVPEDAQGYLGVRISTVTNTMADEFDMPAGVYVNEVIAGTAAERAQLQAGDIIVGVNGITIATKEQLSARITCYRYGTTVTLTIMRRVQGEYQTAELPVVLMSKEEMDAVSGQ